MRSTGKVYGQVIQRLPKVLAHGLWLHCGLKAYLELALIGQGSCDFSRYQHSSLYRAQSYESHSKRQDAVYKGSPSLPHPSPLHTSLFNHNHILCRSACPSQQHTLSIKLYAISHLLAVPLVYPQLNSLLPIAIYS